MVKNVELVVALFERDFALQSRAEAILSVILRYFALNVGAPKCRPTSAPKCNIQTYILQNVHFEFQISTFLPKKNAKCKPKSTFELHFLRKSQNVGPNQLQNALHFVKCTF